MRLTLRRFAALASSVAVLGLGAGIAASQTSSAAPLAALPIAAASHTLNADGSTVTRFMVDGGADAVIFVTPPAGFNPVTASDAQLAAYNLPSRPTDPTQLALWTATMAKAKFSVPKTVYQDPTARNEAAGPWAGEYDYNYTTGYTEAVGYYNEPANNSSSCGSNPAPYLSSWIGLGGVISGNVLSQVGTTTVPGDSAPHEAFVEEWSTSHQNPPIYLGIYGVVGTSNATYAQYQGTYNGIPYVKYFFENHAGQSMNPEYADAGFDGSTADFVFEAPQVNGTRSSLINFGTGNFTYAGTNYGALGVQPYEPVYIPGTATPGPPFPVNPVVGNTAANPGSVSGNDAFPITWYHCAVHSGV